MITLVRTNSENSYFINLIQQLDAYLKITDGDEHDFFNKFNHIDVIKHVVIAYDKNKAIGCGAIKTFDKTTAEIKRMYVLPKERGKGTAQKIVTELELWASELNYKSCILETGTRQIEAVHFYKKCGYKTIPNYGQYVGMENSVCFEKVL